ncbi:hypothetical protein HNR42_002294 [Deinobacterium chartae]|uniref:Lipoprotein n=1 Tax=Deinobacterium chartae TaxID=521158 RepID=A0A841I3E7_9DEIO|nr:hypothetical protein [Deinobacterium chartae]MBB6098859.1 hypothetical protein [Deinobacterium chartae]
MNKIVWILLGLLAWLGVTAHAAPIERCGPATLRVTQTAVRDGYSMQRLELHTPAGSVSVEDASVSADWCQDLDQDGQPEVLLSGYSGGAHCCTTHYLYQLKDAPRLMLRYFAGNAPGLMPKQLDGKGALELVGSDDRFAYAYGLCYACSPFLIRVFARTGDVYLEASRRFPATVMSGNPVTRVPREASELLGGTASLLLLGRDSEASAYIGRAPRTLQPWIRSYLPQIRRAVSDSGFLNWNLQSSVPSGLEVLPGPVPVGAFSNRGLREGVALVRGSAPELGVRPSGVSLLLFRAGERGLMPAKALMSIDLPPRAGQQTAWQPWLAVTRADGRADLVARDTRSTSAYPVYRLSAVLAPRENDPLALGLRVVGDLEAYATLNAAALSASKEAPTAAQLDARLKALRRWGSPQGARPELNRLGEVQLLAAELPEDRTDSARLRAVVALTFGRPDRNLPVRYALSVQLERSSRQWQVRNWQLERLPELPQDV